MRVSFGAFEVDLTTGELTRSGSPRGRLQEKPCCVLAGLVEEPGRLVPREELRRRLWPDDVHVDYDQGLNKAVLKLRTALGDSAEAPRFIETIPRRGYRFLAAVRRAGEELSVPHRAPQPAPSQSRQSVPRLVWGPREIELRQGENLVGRVSGCNVWVDAPGVSRRHARIVVRRGVATIEDLGSKNGTSVRGRKISGATALAEGDEINVGTAVMVFRLSESARSTETLSR